MARRQRPPLLLPPSNSRFRLPARPELPYPEEYASYAPLRRLVTNERVRELIQHYEVRVGHIEEALPSLVSLTDLDYGGWAPDYLIALDGSYVPVQLRNGYPGAEMACLTIASVLLDMQRIGTIDAARPVDPVQFRLAHGSESIDCALPGSNVVLDDDATADASVRRVVYDVMSSAQMSQGQETLLDTYEALLAYKPTSHAQTCPYDDCQEATKSYLRGSKLYECPCALRRRLHSTDALRFTEGMNEGGGNGATYAEIMQVLERLWVVHMLRTFVANGWAASLGRLAIILDGPLAVFGHPAWLGPAIEKELIRINEFVVRQTGRALMLMGIEKSGPFVEHFTLLDQHEGGSLGRFPRQSAFLIDDAYIKRNIVPSQSSKQYGQDTYFGRKVYYKNAAGARLVVVLPFLAPDHSHLSRAEAPQFPRLADTLHLLDRLFSSRYENAVAALVAAHAAAAIPRHMGQQVFERLARELMGTA